MPLRRVSGVFIPILFLRFKRKFLRRDQKSFEEKNFDFREGDQEISQDI